MGDFEERERDTLSLLAKSLFILCSNGVCNNVHVICFLLFNVNLYLDYSHPYSKKEKKNKGKNITIQKSTVRFSFYSI